MWIEEHLQFRKETIWSSHLFTLTWWCWRLLIWTVGGMEACGFIYLSADQLTLEFRSLFMRPFKTFFWSNRVTKHVNTDSPPQPSIYSGTSYILQWFYSFFTYSKVSNVLYNVPEDKLLPSILKATFFQMRLSKKIQWRVIFPGGLVVFDGAPRAAVNDHFAVSSPCAEGKRTICNYSESLSH